MIPLKRSVLQRLRYNLTTLRSFITNENTISSIAQNFRIILTHNFNDLLAQDKIEACVHDQIQLN